MIDYDYTVRQQVDYFSNLSSRTVWLVEKTHKSGRVDLIETMISEDAARKAADLLNSFRTGS